MSDDLKARKQAQFLARASETLVPMTPLMGEASKALGGGKMAQAIQECLAMRKTLLDGGMPVDEVNRITGEGLRQVWQGREQPWKFLCQWCSDTGWIIREFVDDRSEFVYGPGASRREAFKCRDCRYWQKQAEEDARTHGKSDDPISSAASTTKRNYSR